MKHPVASAGFSSLLPGSGNPEVSWREGEMMAAEAKSAESRNGNAAWIRKTFVVNKLLRF